MKKISIKSNGLTFTNPLALALDSCETVNELRCLWFALQTFTSGSSAVIEWTTARNFNDCTLDEIVSILVDIDILKK